MPHFIPHYIQKGPHLPTKRNISVPALAEGVIESNRIRDATGVARFGG